MACKRPHEQAFAFDLTNCIGCDEDLLFGGSGLVAPATAAPPRSDAVPSFEPLPGEPPFDPLGATYSPVHDGEDGYSDGCKTPDPMAMLDGAALAALLAGGDATTGDAAYHPPLLPPLAPQPSVLNQSGHFGCHATHAVADPPRLAPIHHHRAEWQEPREFKMTKPPVLDLYNTVHENHAGVFSDYGGVRAWMRR